MFAIDFTKPWLYKEITTFNQGNLSKNNSIRCVIHTGGDDDLTNCNIKCSFIVSGREIPSQGSVVEGLKGVVDIIFPAEALVVGINQVEIFVHRPNGGNSSIPSVKL